MVGRLGFTILLILVSTSGGLAQETTGDLKGRLLDGEGNPVAYANVVVAGPDLQGTRGVLSRSDGSFVILELPIGVYSITISHIGYQQVRYAEVLVQLGRTTALGDISLTAREHEVAERVVRAPRPLIDHTSTNIGTNLRAADYEALPIERNYHSITTLLPHINETFLGDGIGAAGGTGLENKSFVDGVDVSNPVDGAVGTQLPYNFIREVQVKTGAYEAEYRSSLGTVVNVVTYSGGNEFQARAFAFLINNQFTSGSRQRAYEKTSGQDFMHYDVGASLSGPILRDRLWFFGAYNPTIVNEDVLIPGIGAYEDHSEKHRFAGKLTWRATDQHDLAVMVSGDPETRRSVGVTTVPLRTPVDFENPDPYLADMRTGMINLSLTGRHRFTDRFLLKSQVSRVHAKYDHRAATDRGRQELLVIDMVTGGTWSGGGTGDYESLNNVTAAGITATLLDNRHTLKTGFEYRNTQQDLDGVIRAIWRYNDTTFVGVDYTSKGTIQHRVPSAFVQDSWLVNDQLRLNAGLRWDGQVLVDTSGEVAQKILDQWQPRVGLVYSWGQKRSQKAVASFGRFYQELGTTITGIYYTEGRVYDWIAWDHDPREDPSGGVTFDSRPSSIQPEIDGLEGQHYDEFMLGYERQLSQSAKLGLRGVYRTLRQGIEDGHDPVTGEAQLNNPGEGLLSAYPKISREYSALEVVFEHSHDTDRGLYASYVLSRTYGNYPGLHNTDFDMSTPNGTMSFDWPSTVSTGLLPNDRTHVFKVSGFRGITYGVTGGVSFVWQSGTPINEFGAMPEATGEDWAFVRKRGTAGRSPSIWDLNVRLLYEPLKSRENRLQPRITVDFLHVVSREKPVLYEEIHYTDIDEDGNLINPLPTYGQPTRYQPPMAVRLGIEVAF